MPTIKIEYREVTPTSTDFLQRNNSSIGVIEEFLVKEHYQGVEYNEAQEEVQKIITQKVLNKLFK
jgi:hypothetical protein